MAVMLSLVLLLACTVQAQGININLKKHLFDPMKHNSRNRPATSPYKAVNVTFGLSLHEIVDLDDKSQRLKVRITIRQNWFDPFLSWNKSEFGGIENITVHPETIWIPDIVLYNSAGVGFGDGVMRTQAIISHDGLVRMNIPSILKSTCKVHLENYPFDQQHCRIKFGSWNYDGSQLGLVLESTSADLTSYTPNVEWELLGIPAEFHSKKYLCCPNPYHDIVYFVKLKRRSLFYAMYLIIPCAVISFLTVLVFLLPPECSERITVGMAILVGLSFFFLLVAENMPATSDVVPLIGVYYSVTLIEVSVAFFMTCFVLICHHHNPTHGDLPPWVRKYIRWPARFLGFPFEAEQDLTSDMQPQNDDKIAAGRSVGKVNEGFADDVLITRRKKTSSQENKHEENQDPNIILKGQLKRKDVLEKRQDDWQMLALVLNSIFMWTYVTAVFMTIGIIFVPQFLS